MEIDALTLWTIGHSTRSIDEFITLLQAQQIGILADVRRYPGSRKYPHFNTEALNHSLAQAGIEYHLLAELGGRRRPKPDSRNTVWRNEAFRGYADYMETPAFAEAIDGLMRFAQSKRTAVMCSEAVWWRCHRSLISDYLKARGVTVLHILGADKVEPHPFTSAAKLIDGQLSYVAEA